MVDVIESDTFKRWDVTQNLQTKEDMRLYLEACAEEDPGDGSLICAALNDIARAQSAIRLAGEAGMSLDGLNRELSENREPTFATIMRIASALGMRLKISA